jgi:5-methylcytosine-specific restriction endonuclease McrA
MAKIFLENKDPVLKAHRVLGKKRKESIPGKAKETSKNETQGLLSQKSSRKPLPRQLKYQIDLRDHGKCQAQDKAGLCGDSRWIDYHHIKPVHEGGQNSLENLVTLCRSHHRIIHSH